MDKRPAYSRAFYILTFAGECPHRYRALLCSLQWLQSHRCQRLSIVLVVARTMRATWLHNLKYLVDYFVYQDAPESSAHFCRSAYLNAGARYVAGVANRQRSGFKSSGKDLGDRQNEDALRSIYLWFADADIIVVNDADGARVDLQCLRVPPGAIVSPFTSVHDSPASFEHDAAVTNLSAEQVCQFPSRRGLSFSGGILGMPYCVWQRFGCRWDEQFRGWGFEDAAMDTAVYRLCASETALDRFSVLQWQFAALHIWHPHADQSEETRLACAQQLEKSKRRFQRHYPTYSNAFNWFRNSAAVVLYRSSGAQ